MSVWQLPRHFVQFLSERRIKGRGFLSLSVLTYISALGWKTGFYCPIFGTTPGSCRALQYYTVVGADQPEGAHFHFQH